MDQDGDTFGFRMEDDAGIFRRRGLAVDANQGFYLAPFGLGIKPLGIAFGACFNGAWG